MQQHLFTVKENSTVKETNNILHIFMHKFLCIWVGLAERHTLLHTLNLISIGNHMHLSPIWETIVLSKNHNRQAHTKI